MSLLLCSLLFASESTQSKTASQYGNISVNEDFISFSGWTLDGNNVSLSSILKQEQQPDVIIISYFATWCGPCRKGMPHIEALAQSDPKISALYISIDSIQDENKLKPFVKELELKSPIIWDKHKVIAKRHGIISQETQSSSISIPKTFVVDETGKTLSIFVEEGDDFSEQLKEVVTQSRQ